MTLQSCCWTYALKIVQTRSWLARLTIFGGVGSFWTPEIWNSRRIEFLVTACLTVKNFSIPVVMKKNIVHPYKYQVSRKLFRTAWPAVLPRIVRSSAYREIFQLLLESLPIPCTVEALLSLIADFLERNIRSSPLFSVKTGQVCSVCEASD